MAPTAMVMFVAVSMAATGKRHLADTRFFHPAFSGGIREDRCLLRRFSG
jgi:hypothetical protein